MPTGPAGALRTTAIPFIGREAEQAVLRACLDEVATGSGAAVVVEGEAGIGKSRLLDDCVAVAAAAGFHVWTGRASELARDRPFGPLIEALGLRRTSPDPDRAALARDLADDHLPHGGLRFRILDDLLDLVERDAQTGPCVLALDDLQWADPSTLLALDHLRPRTASLPVLLAVTCRPTPRTRELVATLESIAESGDHHLRLAPLTPDSVRRLTSAVLDGKPGPRLDDLVRRAGGNPFFLLELLSALSTAAAITTREGIAETDLSDAPESASLLVLRRLSFLPEPALDVLRTAAVLGSTFSLADLALVGGRPAADVLGPLTNLLRNGVVVDAGDHLRFAHDLVREALYYDIPRAVRQDLHRDAARLLAEAGAAPEVVASQMALGARPGDTEAVAWMRRAARETRSRGPMVASRLLQRAIEVVGDDVGTRAELAAELAQALVWAGAHQLAIDAAYDALDRSGPTGPTDAPASDPGVEGRIRLHLGQALLLQGRPVDAVRELELAAASCHGVEAAEAAAAGSGAALLNGNRAAAQRLADMALHLNADDDHDVACIAYTILAWVADLGGDFTTSAVLIAKALERAEHAGQRPLPFVGTHGVLGVFLVSAGYVDDAAWVLERGRRNAEAFGAVADLPAFHSAVAMLHLWRGEWDDALAEIETSMIWWRQHGSSLGIIWPLAMRSYIHLRRGELDEAAAAVNAAEAEILAGNSQYGLSWLLQARALLSEAQGQVDAAADALHNAWQLAQALGARSVGVEIGPDLIRLLLRQHRLEEAAAVAASVTALAADGEFVLPRASALRCRGVVEREPGLLLEAVELLGTGPRPLLAAFAAEEAGGVLAAAGDRDGAVTALTDALARFDGFGAGRDAARVEAALRAVGVRRGRRGPRRRPAAGWASLTPTEATVARLATDGLTNRQIGERLYISRRTVETHLSHVFTKLGVASRVEVAAHAARQASVT